MKRKKIDNSFYIFLILSFIIRVLLSTKVYGFPNDIACFKGWAESAAKNGLSAFYTSGQFVDYPPGYIYVLWCIGIIKNVFLLDYNSNIFLVLVKLPAIISDILSCILIYKINKKINNQILGFSLAFLYSFNPAVFHNSVFFGQIDSVFTFFILLCVWFIYNEKLEIVSIFYVIAVLIKPQALIFAPVGIYEIIKRKNLKVLFNCLSIMFVLSVILLLPFSIKQNNIFWFFKLYKNAISFYSYASVNAFNLFSLSGGNWSPITDKFFIFSYEVWGYILIFSILVFGTFVSIIDYLKERKKEWSAFFALFLIAGVYILGPKMHERYIYPALALSLICFSLLKDKRILIIFLGFSITLFFNQEYLLNMAVKQNIFWIKKDDIILIIMSLTNILLFIYLIKVIVDIFIFNRVKILSYDVRKNGVLIEENKLLDSNCNKSVKYLLSKKDLILLSLLTLTYASIAFTNLGSLKGPKTFWKPKITGDYFIVDLGEIKNIKKIRHFLTLGSGSYLLSFSNDGNTWGNYTTIEHQSVYDMIRWIITDLDLKVKYIKIAVNRPGLMFNELGFFDNNDKYISIKNIEKYGLDNSIEEDPERLFDEKDVIPYKYSYLNSMYFDETYHARTAYENINDIHPTETTHPPLGKIIISIGILLFGMNPFGWRFMGTLLGVIMVPIMYLFGKRLFKSTEGAFATSLIFTFDFMHFVQTRIATIDVYGVFFIILMYYFMYQYYSMNFFETGLKKTLLPLLLCGISFGLGCASKWIVIYGGAGLAVLFIITTGNRFREYYNAKRIILKINKKSINIEKIKYYKNIIASFPGYLTKTILCCVLFFIIIPVTIYFLSYLPIITLPEIKAPVSFVINDQKNMYNYHAKINATHAFSSSWWEWPIMIKPIWYYGNFENIPAGKVSSIVAFGNPLVWWIGMIFLIAAIFLAIRDKNRQILFVAIAFFSQYLPWIIIPRKLVYIYHFFSAVPFLVFSIVFVLLYLKRKFSFFKYIYYGYLGLVLIIFAMFYPVLSGMVVNKVYVESFLKWMSSWVF